MSLLTLVVVALGSFTLYSTQRSGYELFLRDRDQLLLDVIVHVHIVVSDGRDKLVVLLQGVFGDTHDRVGDGSGEQEGLTGHSDRVWQALDNLGELSSESLVEQSIGLIENEGV